MTDVERFRSKIKIIGACHIWQGPLDKDGYGTFWFKRKNRRAHRVAWFFRHDEGIPDGALIGHQCRNRNCVNADHIVLTDPKANALVNSNSIAFMNALKTRCPRGHLYDKVVTYGKAKKRTQRVCSTCERERHKRLSKKWRAEDTLNV